MTRLQIDGTSHLSFFGRMGLALMLSVRFVGGAEKSAARGAALFAYPPNLPDARAEVYKAIGQTNLQLYMGYLGGPPQVDKFLKP
jgi:hypothetical protein